MCAPLPTNLKTDRNKQKMTEMNRNGQKQTIMERYRQICSETVRNSPQSDACSLGNAPKRQVCTELL